MSIIEQIKAEVERRKLDGLEHGLTFVPTAMQSLLEFLDTLQKQSVREETIYTLNGLMQQFIKEGENDAEQERRARAYKAFFNAMDYEPEPVCEGLEEEVKRYYSDEYAYITGNQPTLSIVTNIARHFAKWQKEQMMKELFDNAEAFEEELSDVFQSATTMVSSPSELAEAFKERLLRSAFKCFAEKKALRQSLFAKQFSELPDEIKAVVERIAHDSSHTFCDSFATLVAADKGYRKGQLDKGQQMMKEAVEGEVCGRVYDHINVRFADGVCKYLEPKNISHIPADVSKYNIGDKVRVIIVKEDKQ